MIWSLIVLVWTYVIIALKNMRFFRTLRNFLIDLQFKHFYLMSRRRISVEAMKKMPARRIGPPFSNQSSLDFNLYIPILSSAEIYYGHSSLHARSSDISISFVGINSNNASFLSDWINLRAGSGNVTFHRTMNRINWSMLTVFQINFIP